MALDNISPIQGKSASKLLEKSLLLLPGPFINSSHTASMFS